MNIFNLLYKQMLIKHDENTTSSNSFHHYFRLDILFTNNGGHDFLICPNSIAMCNCIFYILCLHHQS